MSLPKNVRVGDYVQIIGKDVIYRGMVGRVEELIDNKYVKVNVYGKDMKFLRSDLKIAARTGTGKHDEHKEEELSREPSHIGEDELNEMINLAIDMQDWKWANELVERKVLLKVGASL